MHITLELPDDVGLQARVKDLPRALLNSFALEGYRSGTLTEEQVRRLLSRGSHGQRFPDRGRVVQQKPTVNYNAN